jgi:tyrosine aminotransferase
VEFVTYQLLAEKQWEIDLD